MNRISNTMKVLAAILVFIAGSSFLSGGWETMNSGTSNQLNSVYFFNTLTGIVVGNSGTILKTTDGGTTWSSKSSGTSYDLISVYFVNSTTGFAVGAAGITLKTDNTGETWTEIDPKITYFQNCIHFNGQNGISVGYNGSVKYTFNGGTGWYAASSISPTTSAAFNGCSMITSDIGIAAGSGGVIYRTTNGGINWTNVSIVTYNTITSVSFWNTNEGIFVGYSGTAFKSTNIGVNWGEITNIGSSAAFYCVKAIPNTNTAYIAGDNGIIYKTTNKGSTWSSQCSGTNIALRSAFFIDENNGFVVGTSGKILKTNNGGDGCIYTGTVSTLLCPGSTLSVPYTITGTYNQGNIFTAQLSNTSGN
ncbi:MAG: hypothetical protein QG635_1466, partial [Bacteroidota bacterium]|nr:hypothetical protein [Bacteroidota bacterium]